MNFHRKLKRRFRWTVALIIKPSISDRNDQITWGDKRVHHTRVTRTHLAYYISYSSKVFTRKCHGKRTGFILSRAPSKLPRQSHIAFVSAFSTPRPWRWEIALADPPSVTKINRFRLKKLERVRERKVKRIALFRRRTAIKNNSNRRVQ